MKIEQLKILAEEWKQCLEPESVYMHKHSGAIGTGQEWIDSLTDGKYNYLKNYNFNPFFDLMEVIEGEKDEWNEV